MTRVLVIDDDPSMRGVIRHALAEGNTEVVEAGDGEQGLELARHGNFALVILDWNMPGPGGPEVLDALRRDQPELPILMVTAELTEREGGLALAMGADAFMAKPFSPAELARVVDSLVR